MSTSDYKNAQIEKLKGIVNWITWRQQIETKLLFHDLWDVTGATDIFREDVPVIKDRDGNVKEPEAWTDKEKAKMKAWHIKNARAAALIADLCEPEVRVHITDIEHARERLKKLKTLYQPSGRSVRSVISRQLFGLRMSEGGDLEKHFNEMRTKYRQYLEAGGSLGEGEEGIVDLFLQSLPESWSNMVESINLVLDTTPMEISLDYIYNQLTTRLVNRNKSLSTKDTKGPKVEVDKGDTVLMKALRTITLDEDDGHDEQLHALATALNNRGFGRGRGRGRGGFNGGGRQPTPVGHITCYGCGKKGHYQSDCLSSDNSRQNRPAEQKRFGSSIPPRQTYNANLARGEENELYQCFASRAVGHIDMAKDDELFGELKKTKDFEHGSGGRLPLAPAGTSQMRSTTIVDGVEDEDDARCGKAVALATKLSREETVLDSGASGHMFRDRSYFVTYTDCDVSVYVGDGRYIKALLRNSSIDNERARRKPTDVHQKGTSRSRSSCQPPFYRLLEQSGVRHQLSRGPREGRNTKGQEVSR